MDGEKLSARVALIETSTAGQSKIAVSSSDLFTISAWLENTPTPVQTPAGEYIPVIFLPDGKLALVSPIQDFARDRWGFTWWVFAAQ
jgi:hypothetical protein